MVSHDFCHAALAPFCIKRDHYVGMAVYMCNYKASIITVVQVGGFQHFKLLFKK